MRLAPVVTLVPFYQLYRDLEREGPDAAADVAQAGVGPQARFDLLRPGAGPELSAVLDQSAAEIALWRAHGDDYGDDYGYLLNVVRLSVVWLSVGWPK